MGKKLDGSTLATPCSGCFVISNTHPSTSEQSGSGRTAIGWSVAFLQRRIARTPISLCQPLAPRPSTAFPPQKHSQQQRAQLHSLTKSTSTWLHLSFFVFGLIAAHIVRPIRARHALQSRTGSSHANGCPGPKYANASGSRRRTTPVSRSDPVL